MPLPASHVAGRPCSQSGNMIRLSSSSLQLLTAVQRLTGCWRCDISHPPRHAPCSTVQLVTVARCPVSPSLYSRWLRHELPQPSKSQPRVRVIAIRLVADRKWSLLIEANPSYVWCYLQQVIGVLYCILVIAGISSFCSWDRTSWQEGELIDISTLGPYSTFSKLAYCSLMSELWHLLQCTNTERASGA